MTPAVLSASVNADHTSLLIQWSDGTAAEFASIWLRDNLPEDRDEHSGQRLIDVTELPANPLIQAVALCAAELRIHWMNEARISCFALKWLFAHSPAGHARALAQRRYWLEGAQLDAKRDFAWQSLSALKAAAEARREWLMRLLEDGIAFMSDVPPVEQGILEAVSLVGRVCETNYGLVFDVRAVLQPENLAYSDRGLGLHTDNPYREPVPGFQALHTLIAAPDGGESLFADGFSLAEQLRACAPEHFAILTRTPVAFRYQSREADLSALRPLIELDCQGAVSAVHYNSRSIAALDLPAEHCRAFYAAYRHFAQLLHQSRFQVSMRLENEDLVLFDNRRILHGRTGFASNRHARHLRGCYLTRDSVYSEAALLQRRAKPG